MKTPHLNTWFPVYAVGGAVCTAISLVAWFTVLSSALRQHDQRIVKANELSARRHKASELASSVAALRRKSDAIDIALRQSAMRLEPAALVNDRLARLTELANECGLSVDEVQPGQTTDGSHYQSVALKLAGSGNYPACARFLHRLHDGFPDTGVRALDTSNNSPNPLSPAVSFRLDLVWYAAPLPHDPKIARNE